MREFILSNQLGSNLQEAIENPSMHHSIIIVRNPDGTEDDPIPWTPLTHNMYKPKPDPRYKKPQKIITSAGEIEIPPYVSEDEINIGENPFVQLIYRYAGKKEGAFREDLVRYLTKEKKVLPDNTYGIKRAERYIDEMHRGDILGGLLIFHTNKYFTGIKLKTERRTITIYPGYEPIEYEIMNHVEQKGHASREGIHRYIMDILRWARFAKTVEYYLKKLVKQKNLKTIRKDWFEVNKHLDAF